MVNFPLSFFLVLVELFSFFFFPCLVSALFLLQENMLRWVRNYEARLNKVSVLQESNAELNISLNLMEHLEEGQ